MVTSIEHLVRTALGDPRIAAVVGEGDWYLTGSRAIGADDELSDWDTMVFLSGEKAVADLSGTHLDQVFAVVRPDLPWPPDLAGHVRWRAAAGVEIELLGPDARAVRERHLVEWAYELRHAVALRASTGFAEDYRRQVAGLFAARLVQLTQRAYGGFRSARNQAVSRLARPDAATQVLTAAHCVTEAARFWMLAGGQPHPVRKWLLHALGRLEGTGDLLILMRAALDPYGAPEARFDALWDLWRLVDERAVSAAVDPALLAGSPFAG
jgi:hypothetical protein